MMAAMSAALSSAPTSGAPRRSLSLALWLPAMLCIACGGGQTDPKSGNDTGEDGGGEAEVDIPTTPLKEGPPALTDAEKSELGGKCNLIEPDMYDANKQGIAVLAEELDKGTDDAAAEKKGLEAAKKMLAEKAKGLDASDMTRCTELFDKRTKRALFEHEPTEQVARDAVKSCVERVNATVGKKNMAYDMGGTGNATAGSGPFCPDDFPVPPSLKDLPYKSKSDDWDTAAWKCLGYGLRVEQNFQIEYAAPYGTNEFQCIARFLPRQGGAPFELIRGGKIGDGELLVEKSIKKRRMTK